MNLRPLSDRILVKRIEADKKTKGGIIVPDNAQEKPQKGEVVAVGPGKMSEEGERIKMELKKGDKVLFAKYSGDEVELKGKELLIMRENDVLAVIN